MTKDLQTFFLRRLGTGIVISILLAWSSFPSDATEMIVAVISKALTG